MSKKKIAYEQQRTWGLSYAYMILYGGEGGGIFAGTKFCEFITGEICLNGLKMFSFF